MKRYKEHCAVEIVERDPLLAVTRLIDNPTTQTPGLVTMALVRTEMDKAGFSKTPNSLGNTIFTLSTPQKETES